jgi:hypothetical protein
VKREVRTSLEDNGSLVADGPTNLCNKYMNCKNVQCKLSKMAMLTNIKQEQESRLKYRKKVVLTFNMCSSKHICTGYILTV